MPSVSQAQRRAMAAAAAGHSTLGIPKSVGKEFMAADPGGHLPDYSKPMVRRLSGRKGTTRHVPFFMHQKMKG